MQLENSGIYVAVVEWQMSTRKNQDDIFAVQQLRQAEMRSGLSAREREKMQVDGATIIVSCPDN